MNFFETQMYLKLSKINRHYGAHSRMYKISINYFYNPSLSGIAGHGRSQS
eukprot:UN18656